MPNIKGIELIKLEKRFMIKSVTLGFMTFFALTYPTIVMATDHHYYDDNSYFSSKYHHRHSHHWQNDKVHRRSSDSKHWGRHHHHGIHLEGSDGR
jgi:hypothetical protein